MPEPLSNPTCPCGYDLSGLPGPPWTCPECAQILNVWPIPVPGPRNLTPLEQRFCQIAIGTVILFASAFGCFFPGTDLSVHAVIPNPTLGDLANALNAKLLFGIVCGALAYAFFHSRDYKDLLPHQEGRYRILRFVRLVNMSLLIASISFGGGLLLGRAMGPIPFYALLLAVLCTWIALRLK